MTGRPAGTVPENAAFLARSDPQALWPDLTPDDHARAHARIAQTARAVLAGERPHLAGADAVATRAIGIAAFSTGMGALLGHWIGAGTVTADAPVRELLTRHLEHGRRRARTFHEALLRILATCAREDVVPTLLKGLHTARTYFLEPGARAGADLDLLVSSGQVARARIALQNAGFSEHRGLSRPTRSTWIAAGAPRIIQSVELNHADNPWSVDLHVALERDYFRGRSAGLPCDAPAHTETFSVDGQPARVLAQPLLTAFLALHASYNLHELQLVRLVELVLVIRADRARGRLDWPALSRLLHQSGTLRFVYPACELAERLAPGTLDPALRSALRGATTRRLRGVVNAITASGGFILPHRSIAEKLMWAKGPWEILCNASELVWPSDPNATLGERVDVQLRRLRMLATRRARVRARR